MRTFLVVLVLLGSLSTLRAEEEAPKPMSVAQAADAVRAAVEDPARLKQLASVDDPDPWLVAEYLRAKGHGGAASKFARAAPRPEVAKLPAYLEAAEPAIRVKALQALHEKARALEDAESFAESRAAVEKLAKDAEQLGWYLGPLHMIWDWSFRAAKRGAWKDAVAGYRAVAALQQARSSPDGVGRALEKVSQGLVELSDWAAALETGSEALKLATAANDAPTVTSAHLHLARAHHGHGRLADAQAHYESYLAGASASGDRTDIAVARNGLGRVLMDQSKYLEALPHYKAFLEISSAMGREADPASENYRRRKANESTAHNNIGEIHRRLGDFEKALPAYDRALEIAEKLDDPPRMLLPINNLGATYWGMGRFDDALPYFEQALSLSERQKDREGIAIGLNNLGALHFKRGNSSKALELWERSLAAKEELGDRMGMAATLTNMCAIAGIDGRTDEAIAYGNHALQLSREVGARSYEIGVFGALARAYVAKGEPAKAIDATREAITVLNQLYSGLAQRQGAGAREQYRDVFETGVLAAASAERVEDALFFLESSRAGMLLAALGGAVGNADADIPAELLEAEREARAAEAKAMGRYRRAMYQRKLKESRAARKDLRVAREQVQDAVEAIQRQSKATADVYYPRAAEANAIRASLADDEALLLYGILEEKAFVLALDRKGGTLVQLGDSAAIREAAAKLDLRRPKGDPAQAIDALRALVAAPVTLAPGVRRLLVSPHAELSYVPFQALFPDRDIVYVPSGTTLRMMRSASSPSGTGVLALGDPDYLTAPDVEAVSRHRAGALTKLLPLPETRIEVEALGTTKLLGAQATEARLLAALGTQPRWRAVHLACHGLVSPQPLSSSLALTPDPENAGDGFLTVAEIFRMRIPADLVVLSACETARGKIYKTEGIVGLTRAFMFAGAQRVLCSLWKVDDEATRALMIRFYELWSPKEGKGLDAAAALRKAQEHVRSQAKWKHPYFWAAWVLWGLPE